MSDSTTSIGDEVTILRERAFHDVARFMAACDHRIKDQNTWELYWNMAGDDIHALMTADTLDAELSGIVNSIWTLVGYGLARGYDVSGAWGEVARANLSKIGSNGICAKDINGKVLSPDGWRGPNLLDFLPEESLIVTDI